MWQGYSVVNRPLNHWKYTKSYRLIGYLLLRQQICLKCIERSIKSVEYLEGCRFARYSFTKSIHFVSSPPVARRHKMPYYVVIRLVILFFGYYVSEQYERSTVFCTSSRAQEKYSSDGDSGRLRVLDLTSQGD